MKSFSATSVSPYIDPRMLRILVLGFTSGFPWVLIATSLTLWLKEEGLSRSTIGWAGLIFSVYAINWVWAPLIDKIRIPYISTIIGHRKSWILTMQVAIMFCLFGWSLASPSATFAEPIGINIIGLGAVTVSNGLFIVIGIGLIIAIASATQDITIDALRIEQFSVKERESMAAGAAVAVIGWWTGYKIGGMITLFISEYLENSGYNDYWQITFRLMCLLMVAINFLVLLIPEQDPSDREKQQNDDFLKIKQSLPRSFGYSSFIIAWLGSTVISPLSSFFKKNGLSLAIAILSFIFLFKIGEAFVGKMSIVFYKEMDFSKSDIAIYSKGLGWITTVVFTIIGGWFAFQSGIIRVLFIAGMAMAATNLIFSVMAWTEKSYMLFAIAVIVDDLAAAFATVAFVAFISLLVDRTYTATQYALLASIGTLGRTTLASSSGALVDWLGGDWGIFFILTTIMVIPSLMLLWKIRDKLKLG